MDLDLGPIRQRLDMARRHFTNSETRIADLKASALGDVPALLAEVERLRADVVWKPGRWWRVVTRKGRLRAESSDEEEIRGLARPGDRVQNLYVTEQHGEWRDA